jgi:DivIVA domain-containing protein
MGSPFAIVLRGYDTAEVDRVLDDADRAAASGSATARAAARGALERVAFRQRLRGYDRGEVDRAVRERLARLGDPAAGPAGEPPGREFLIVLRGYDMAEVDRAFAHADRALASDSAVLRASAAQALRGIRFRERLRGYAPRQVDRAVRHCLEQLGGHGLT